MSHGALSPRSRLLQAKENLPREVNDSGIEKQLSGHSGCTNGGEFAMDNFEEVDAVFLAVIEVIQDLRKVAVRWNLPEDKKKNSAVIKIKNFVGATYAYSGYHEVKVAA
jgi:hypothetical protein